MCVHTHAFSWTIIDTHSPTWPTDQTKVLTGLHSPCGCSQEWPKKHSDRCPDVWTQGYTQTQAGSQNGNSLAHEPLPEQAVPVGLHPHRHTLPYLACWDHCLTLSSLHLVTMVIRRDVVSRPQLLTSPDPFIRPLFWVTSLE